MNLLKPLARGWRYKGDRFVAERRAHPRYVLELPIHYSTLDGQERWGIAGDASEGGLLVYLHEFIEKGSLLKLEMFSPRGAELNAIKAMVKVAWSDSVANKPWEERRHGLAFQAFQKGSLDKLRTLLKETTELQRV